MPTPRRKPEISIYDFLYALLFIIENGCKWRALPNEYGNRHTIYVKFNRWCKNGVIDRIFEALQEENIIEIRTEIIGIDSTSVKFHPDAAGARKSSGEQSIGRSKGSSQQRFIWLFTSAKFAMIYRLSAGNKHDAPEGRKFIESFYSEDKHYLSL